MNTNSNEVAYNASATIIFAFVSYTFLFPCNRLVPLDRRTVAVLGATLCYITREFAFRDRTMDVVHSVDFEVLILLASIMAINHLVVHLKETKSVISYLQKSIQKNPKTGFWMVSFAAFIVSPFLTNDGVCLLFVEPILTAFDHLLSDGEEQHNAVTVHSSLKAKDIPYFLLGLACSANIGSALTYTGNPQNMIVAQDSISVLPPYLFLAYMIIPAVTAWLITTMWIERCWNQASLSAQLQDQLLIMSETSSARNKKADSNCDCDENIAEHDVEKSPQTGDTLEVLTGWSEDEMQASRRRIEKPSSPHLIISAVSYTESSWFSLFGSPPRTAGTSLSPLSPGRRRARKRQHLLNNVVHVISSPFPYMILLLLAAMVVMIFVDVMSISALVCVSAIGMVTCLVIGNHWRGKPIWKPEAANKSSDKEKGLRSGSATSMPLATADCEEEAGGDGLLLPASASSHRAAPRQHGHHTSEANAGDEGENSAFLTPMTHEDKIDNINDFFEELFNSLDYSLLIIFSGTFVVVANLDSTGIPKLIWNKIVGNVPFNTVGSVVGICVFVLGASQLLGNVAVIQLAKPNIEVLGESERKFAWALISFVATVGGNLTITGSAANIIVAEKIARLDPNSAIDFFSHYRVCFWVTLCSCFVGASIVTGIFWLESSVAN